MAMSADMRAEMMQDWPIARTKFGIDDAYIDERVKEMANSPIFSAGIAADELKLLYCTITDVVSKKVFGALNAISSHKLVGALMAALDLCEGATADPTDARWRDLFTATLINTFFSLTKEGWTKEKAHEIAKQCDLNARTCGMMERYGIFTAPRPEGAPATMKLSLEDVLPMPDSSTLH